MMLKMFGGLALALGMTLAGTTAAVPTATDCCELGLSCCPDGPCCTGATAAAKGLAGDCCAAGLPYCDPPSACCADCCAAGAACCPDGSCCLAARGAKAKARGCGAASSKGACCAK
jgi:hypothetical protein